LKTLQRIVRSTPKWNGSRQSMVKICRIGKHQLEKDFEERRQRQEREEAQRTSALNQRLEEQRLDHEKLDEKRKKQEAESNRLWAQVKQGRSRLEAQCEDLIEQTKRMATELANKSRWRRRYDWSRASLLLIDDMKRAAEADRIPVQIREPVKGYYLMCDNCDKTIGVGTYYST
jgi:septal ring factor EnvC (AmiA/AmiB activator)